MMGFLFMTTWSIAILSTLPFLASCTLNKNKAPETPVDNAHHDFVLHMDTAKSNQIPNFSVERFRKVVKEGNKEGSQSQIKTWEFTPSIHHFLHYFIQEGAEFECKDEEAALFCKVMGKDGRFLMDFSIADKKHSTFTDYLGVQNWDYAMHICRVQVGLAITKDNKAFWDHVHAFEVKEVNKEGTRKMEKDKGKSLIYQRIDFTHYQGAIIALASDGEHTRIHDYRALVGIVKEGSDMWMRFVDPNCIRNGVVASEKPKSVQSPASKKAKRNAGRSN